MGRGACSFSPAQRSSTASVIMAHLKSLAVIARASSGLRLISPSICGFLCLDEGEDDEPDNAFFVYFTEGNYDQHCDFSFSSSSFVCTVG